MSTDAAKRGGPAPNDRVPPARGRWTVLFIGDHGRVIAFKRIKTLIWLTVGVLATAFAAVGVLVAVNSGQHVRTRELQRRLEAAQQQMQALRDERDRLTAHVVLAETKMKETLAGLRPPAVDPKPAPALAVDPAAEPPEPADDLKPPAGLDAVVAVEAFHAGFDAARREFDLRYRLVATRPGRKPLAGHVVAVFKGDQLEPERWLAMPRVELPKGRPSGRQKGYSFSISPSKTFAHSMPAPASFPAYSRVVLYVFSHEGQLLMARDYSVDVRASGG